MGTKRRYIFIFVIVICLVCLGSYLLMNRWPGLGAQLARPLRGLIGNEGVAQMETLFFRLQDTAKQAQYRLGVAEAAAPWQVTAVPLTMTTSPTQMPTVTSTPVITSSPAHLLTPSPSPPPRRPVAPSPTAPLTPSPTFTPTPTSWTLPVISPFGTLEGEGLWQPYLSNSTDEVVGLRTFLQPDAERPYTIVAIVAFDLNQTKLHYVLGSEEPALADGPRGYGYLNEADKQPDTLLATFNGGFMASHGEYGAMADGLVALPAKNGYATVTMGMDGRVQIGEWDNDISAEAPYQSWRQNARLITQNGVINERVYNGSAATWGSSLTGDVVTWRSALGLSKDGTVLYFAAGPSLSMPALADVMQAIGAYNSLLLDINETWVHFAAIRAEGEALRAEPLLPEGMESNPDRYLRQSQRDFFYVTVRP